MKTYTFDCIVIGTGAAGYNAACRLKQQGVNVVIVTEGVDMGTSRNTGSDKQTYYKLTLGGDSPDSVMKMAQNLFDGGAVDGDNALCEAALSVRCFMNLCELGVPFPVNRYGEYIGYKTDHDPYARATSAGPLTSKFMTEALQKQTEKLGIPTLDGLLALELLKENDHICGLLCMEKATGDIVAISSGNIIMCTGGPAGIYADSVYPQGHTGTTSLALFAGAKAQNLTLWQFGLASLAPRWNVSGSYMQVLPRFLSVDPQGIEHEFLLEYFKTPAQALSMVFLKGYQWPFDSNKVLNGSSVIDLLVYRECVLRGRRVYLDFTRNPFDMHQLPYADLSEEARTYLNNADICFGTPYDRLLKMNTPAIELYRSKGVDLKKEYLEIALCAQHCNGGIAVDAWWQTCVPGLFVAGEAAGTHGIARPGGSALNSGQVGSLRAAQYIAKYCNKPSKNFEAIAQAAKNRYTEESLAILSNEDNVKQYTLSVQRSMSDRASVLRRYCDIEELLRSTADTLTNLSQTVGVGGKDRLYLYYKLRDILRTQQAVLTAMLDSAKGRSIGSCLYYDPQGEKPEPLEELFRFLPDNGNGKGLIQETVYRESGFICQCRPVRPIPKNNDFFENTWRTYRDCGNIF